MFKTILDEDSDESNDELYSSGNNTDECSDKSDSDMEYNIKQGSSRKKPKLEEKLNNCKIKRKKTHKVEDCRDIQPNNIKRVTSIRSTNAVIPNSLENKGML